MTKIVNPFAFPFPDERDAEGNGITEGSRGMTMRDWFASQCDVTAYHPAGTLEKSIGRAPTIDELADYIAKIRHIEADCMLAERAKGDEA